MAWEIVIVASVTWIGIDMPLQVVYGVHHEPFFALMRWLTAAILVVDLALLATGRFHESRSERYHKGWLLFDILPALPVGWLWGGQSWLTLRIFKVVRMSRILRRWYYRNAHRGTILRLLFFVYFLALLAHFLACAWALIRPPQGPVRALTHYLHSLYWTITTLTTVGYGDVTPDPNSPTQMIFTMVVMVTGVGLFGYAIGNVAQLLANIDRAQADYRDHLDRISAFLNYHRVPSSLQRRVFDYYNFLWDNRRGYDEPTVLAELPPALRIQVALALKREFVEKVPLFRGASPELVQELALELKPMVFTPGDHIFRAGEIGHHLYIISRGLVEVTSADGHTIYSTLSDGAFFGEIALLFSHERTATIRALEYTDLYSLDDQTFEKILARYSDFGNSVRTEAQRRMEQMKRGEHAL
jgi:voltage-gated potassium channel